MPPSADTSAFSGKIGIQYYTWFDLSVPPLGKEGSGWKNKPHGTFLQPFKYPYGPTFETVSSALFPGGRNYSSLDPETAVVHADQLSTLNVDFAILDVSPFSVDPLQPPGTCLAYQASKIALQGFAQHSGRTFQGAFQLALTAAPGSLEFYQGDKPTIMAYLNDVYDFYNANSALFYHMADELDGGKIKPLLFFYISRGNDVLDEVTLQPVFRGWGGVIPTADQFITNPTRLLRDGSTIFSAFTVRFAVYAQSMTDFTIPDRNQLPPPIEIWPFQCDTTGSKFLECGYASLNLQGMGRNLDRFKQMVQEAQGKSHLVIRSFNEFSSTDEFYETGDAYTLEPNNILCRFDGSLPQTPPYQPFYMWDNVRLVLNPG
jgi:hypothetical protein